MREIVSASSVYKGPQRMESEMETRELVIVQPESPLEFEKSPHDTEPTSSSNFGTTCIGIKTIQQNTHSQNDPSTGIPSIGGQMSTEQELETNGSVITDKFQDGKLSENFGEQTERKHFSEREITYNLVLRKLVDGFMDRSVTYSHQPKSLLHTLCSTLARNFPELGDAYHRERICAYLKACRRNAKKKHGEPYVRMSARYLSAGTAARLAEEIYLKEKDYLLNGQRSLEDSVSYQFHTPPNSTERGEIEASKPSDEATSINGGTPVTLQSLNTPSLCFQSPLDSVSPILIPLPSSVPMASLPAIVATTPLIRREVELNEVTAPGCDEADGTSRPLSESSKQPYMQCVPLGEFVMLTKLAEAVISKSLFKPRHPICLAAFSVRTLKKAGQQAALALTLDSLGIGVCCVPGTRIQHTSSVTELTATPVSIRFRLRTSGDPEVSVAGCAGVGTVISHRAEVSLLDWIPVDSHLCEVRLVTSVKEF
ncbi:hypothetical protein T265_00012 [Opisthorchis viverrini]|uniref:Nucleolar protein 4 helical domain-containing protein n=1 Tax=Opisthorchis viverrini TaxID=6198 RepID=A0A075ADD0_OPIVI|nr:hypothetical protein T265_00012 [Opisthorchis viverrini]KER34125.1 hypothetical protein T265_00012 [Opisthorchis viverrini]